MNKSIERRELEDINRLIHMLDCRLGDLLTPEEKKVMTNANTKKKNKSKYLKNIKNDDSLSSNGSQSEKSDKKKSVKSNQQKNMKEKASIKKRNSSKTGKDTSKSILTGKGTPKSILTGKTLKVSDKENILSQEISEKERSRHDSKDESFDDLKSLDSSYNP